MALVTGLTAARMLAIEAASVVGGSINGSGRLILVRQNGATIDAGSVLGTVPAASETVSGIAELATTAEIAAGTDATKIVTPAGLISRAASLTTTGLVELATDVETIAGTDNTRAVTPYAAKTAMNYIAELDSVTNLDNVVTTGRYWQSSSTEATLALRYPATLAGYLEVFTNPAGNEIVQRYHTYIMDTPGGGVWTRTNYAGTWYAWCFVSGPSLPPPLLSTVNGTITVTATATGTVLPTLTPLSIVLNRPLYVDIRLKAWLISTKGETRASVIMSGATTNAWPLTAWSNALYVNTFANTWGASMAQTVKLNAGTTNFNVQAYRSETTTTHQVNYPILEVVPRNWA